MRQIKFRGKSLKDRTWAYGFYCRHDYGAQYQDKKLIKESCSVHDIWAGGGWAAVEEASIGQFTGLTDAAGKEIYEGDIVRISIRPTQDTAEANERNAELVGVQMPSWIDGGDIIARVSYFDCAFHFIHLQSYLPQCGENVQEPMLNYLFYDRHPEVYQSYDQTIEVIGNIHDNPDLVKR